VRRDKATATATIRLRPSHDLLYQPIYQLYQVRMQLEMSLRPACLQPSECCVLWAESRSLVTLRRRFENGQLDATLVPRSRTTTKAEFACGDSNSFEEKEVYNLQGRAGNVPITQLLYITLCLPLFSTEQDIVCFNSFGAATQCRGIKVRHQATSILPQTARRRQIWSKLGVYVIAEGLSAREAGVNVNLCLTSRRPLR
jgi:hypothetical protein